MKIAFIGKTNIVNGPANVNNAYKKEFGEKVRFLKYSNMLPRVFEMYKVISESDVIIISSLCISNDIALRIAVRKKKPVLYFMVGCYDAETRINRLHYSKYFGNNERRMLVNAKKIVTVSDSYMAWAKKYFPEYADKFSFVCLGVDWSKYNYLQNSEQKDPYQIVVMGGGRPQKNNLVVCRVVQLLNEKYGKPYHLIVLGRDSSDTEKIKSMKYVENIGQVGPDKVRQILSKTSVFIQNSVFESFGLGSLEALGNGCNILISKDSGVLSVLNADANTDIIQDCTDIDEIALKIINLESVGNNARLVSSIDKEKSSLEFSSKILLSIAESLV